MHATSEQVDPRALPVLETKPSADDAKVARELMSRSSLRAFFAIGVDWAVIVGLAALGIWLHSWLAYIPIMFLIGHRQYALVEGVLHHACHHNLFPKPRWHYYFQFLYGLPFGWDLTEYRKEHLTHHSRFLQEGDVTCGEYEEYGVGTKARPNMFWLWCVRPFLGHAAWHLAIRDFARPTVLVFWCAMVAVFWWAHSLDYLVLYHVVPCFYSLAIFLMWTDISDHYRTTTGTRTDPGFLTNWLTHGEGFHSIHHLYPTIPWFKVGEAHRRIAHPCDVTRGWWDTYRQMRDAKLDAVRECPQASTVDARE